jgi:citrate lyase synthetase
VASVSLKKGKIMTKKKEIAKVPDKAVEKLQDSISFECTKKNGEQFLLLKATEETVFNATGFKKEGSVANILLAITNTLLNAEDNFEKKNVKGNQILSAMTELNPRDGHEGMLISQMLVTYDRAMYCFRMADDNKSCAEMYFSLQNQGVKLMRLYTQQLEALDKHRRKGNQKMIVEHVHVHKGGQAIVGNVNHKGGGGDKVEK